MHILLVDSRLIKNGRPCFARFLQLFAAIVIASLVGCGRSGPATYAIQGTVTFKGKPVPKGTVSFEPDVNSGNRGRGVALEIIDGKYATEKNNGIVGGPHRLVVSGYDGIPYQAGPQMNPMGKPLFDDYELQADLPRDNTVYDISLP